jgi:hypothetical protein
MAGQNQIIGGGFSDFEGSVLANGYLTMQLSHDASQSLGPGQVVAGSSLRVPLDANGNIAGTVLVWPNDQLNPPTTFYTVNAYRRDGSLAWAAPQFQTVLSTPSPFNVGVWVPNNPPSSTGAPVGSVLLQTNGVNNSNQALLNLTAGTGITLTNVGGSVSIGGSGGGSSGLSYMWGPGLFNLYVGTGAGPTNYSGNTVYVFRFQIENALTLHACSIISQNLFNIDGGLGFAIYDSSGNKIVDPGPFNPNTWTGNTVVTNTFTPVTLQPGSYYFAEASDFTGLAIPSSSFVPSTGLGGAGPAMAKLANAIVKTQATAANSRGSGSTGAMPATLGVLTAVADYTVVSPSLPLWT